MCGIGLNGAFREYFSVYRAVLHREKLIGERKKFKPNPNPNPRRLQAQEALALVQTKPLGRHGTESYPTQRHCPTPTTRIVSQRKKICSSWSKFSCMAVDHFWGRLHRPRESHRPGESHKTFSSLQKCQKHGSALAN